MLGDVCLNVCLTVWYSGCTGLRGRVISLSLSKGKEEMNEPIGCSVALAPWPPPFFSVYVVLPPYLLFDAVFHHAWLVTDCVVFMCRVRIW